MYVVYSSQPRHLRATVLQYNQRVHYILSNTVYRAQAKHFTHGMQAKHFFFWQAW